MSGELLELVGFLHSQQPPVRQIALENLVGYSQGQHTHIFKTDDYRPIKDLKVLTRDKNTRTVQQSLTILVNLCDDSSILDLLASDKTFVEYVATSIPNLKEVNADLHCILLANLAKNDQVTRVFDLKRKRPTVSSNSPQDGTAEDVEKDEKVFKSLNVMDCLMDCFVKGSDRSLNKYATYDYLSYFFSDISRFKRGRDYFVQTQDYDNVVPITKLLVFTEIDSKVRRTGVASTIKNSLFDVQSHEKFVFDKSINLLPYLLLPLTSDGDEILEDEMLDLPEELQFLPPDKDREPDHQIIATHVESLLLLSTTKSVRQYLREHQVYSIIRELHKAVEDDVVQDSCERIVQVLMRDDEPEQKVTELDDDEDDDDIVEVL